MCYSEELFGRRSLRWAGESEVNVFTEFFPPWLIASSACGELNPKCLFLVHSRLQNKAALLCFLNEPRLLSLARIYSKILFSSKAPAALLDPIFFYFSFPGGLYLFSLSLSPPIYPPTLFKKTKKVISQRLSLPCSLPGSEGQILKVIPINSGQ